MPMYLWKDLESGKEVEVFRQSFDDYKVPPDDEEAKAAGLTEEQVKAANWEKQLGKNIKVVHGRNWGPGKGNW